MNKKKYSKKRGDRTFKVRPEKRSKKRKKERSQRRKVNLIKKMLIKRQAEK
jgi:hypothetical protein